jgi:hypothetical protein
MGLDMFLFRVTMAPPKAKVLAGGGVERWEPPAMITGLEFEAIAGDFEFGHVEDGHWIEGSGYANAPEVAYWRKANHIHKWFVDNVMGGDDECYYFRVTLEQLQTLRDLCQKVVDNPAEAHRLLPTQSGFFFGGTDYNDWYFHSTSNTIGNLDAILSSKPGEFDQFYYHPSW